MSADGIILAALFVLNVVCAAIEGDETRALNVAGALVCLMGVVFDICN